MHEYSSLQNFWKRYNKVLLDKLSLDKEKKVLEDENSKLKLLLKQYLNGTAITYWSSRDNKLIVLTGISVNEEILSQTNSLFIVNKKSNVPSL